MSVLKKLTEGIVNRDLQKEGASLLNKWEKTGLLEGLDNETKRNGMARLLENQAKELLREASSMAGGDVEGFAAVAFPLVRRVFGGLIANDLVSVQPMSLPSGLIFFLDFTFGTDRSPGLGTDTPELDDVGGQIWQNGDSVYGGGVTGQQVTGGVNLASGSFPERGFYALNTGYGSPTGSLVPGAFATAVGQNLLGTQVAVSALTNAQKAGLQWDPDVLDGPSTDIVGAIEITLSAAQLANVNLDNLIACNLTAIGGGNVEENTYPIRRLTHLGVSAATGLAKDRTSLGSVITMYFKGPAGTTNANIETACDAGVFSFPQIDHFTNPLRGAGSLGVVAGGTNWALEGAGNVGATFDGVAREVIPEIDIKVDAVSVTAVTKKLKAKWTPELGQDLNAYHNLDAEVELTGILSEQIALEIDREIVNDLVKGATAAKYYWSRAPGLFVNKETGAELGASSAAPDFTGTVSEWYETLVETINDVSAQIHRKTLRGGANFIVCSPEIANVLEFTAGFRADVTGDLDRGTVGAVKTGSLSKKWDIYVDPYFPRNLVLVGRRGGSFLESGYVYAPYVPLQVTPTIFGVEDFVPRKGVMTRYAKKMVRPDMYGVVLVRGLTGESGATS